MKKNLPVLILLLLCFSGTILAQSIVVNRFYNSATADGSYDAIELLVIADKLDIRNYIIKDFGNSVTDDGGAKFRFNNVDTWKSLRSGTTIVLRKTGIGASVSYVEDTDASDYKLDILLSNTTLLTDLAPAKAFNLTPTEMVLIRADDGTGSPDGYANAIHALAAGDMSAKTIYQNLGCPKLNSVATAGSASAAGFVYPTNLNNGISAEAALVNLPAYWEKASELMNGFPEGIQVFKTTTPFNGKATKAYAVVFDPRVIEFKPVMATSGKKVSKFYEDEVGKKFACINGGFFGTGASYSLVLYSGVVSAINIKSLSRSVYNSTANTYFPTRGAFGITSLGVPDVSWIYHVGSGNGTIYSYPTPSPNNVNMAPQAVPSATFPAGGTVWKVSHAIGGSPVLIKNNVINITDDEELISIDNTSNRARSAIGHTADGKVVVLAVEGGNVQTAVGMTLADVANMMKEMGCTGAVNLDGGGSTSLTVNGVNAINPSDGTERAVVSAVIIKSKI